jgi:hypothetical protein
MEAVAENPVGGGAERDRKGEESFQDPRPVCGRAVHRPILDFLRTTEVGRRIGPKGDESGRVSGEEGGAPGLEAGRGRERGERRIVLLFSFVFLL